MKFDKPIALAADHGGYELKEAIKAHLDELGVACTDFGTDSTASVDYPDFAAKGCKAVQDGSCALVILCCGTGVGMSMCANKIKGIRACCCSDTFSAEFTRRHNNANALCLGEPQWKGLQYPIECVVCGAGGTLEQTEDGRWKFVIAENGLERDRTTEEGRGVHCDEIAETQGGFFMDPAKRQLVAERLPKYQSIQFPGI